MTRCLDCANELGDDHSIDAHGHRSVPTVGQFIACTRCRSLMVWTEDGPRRLTDEELKQVATSAEAQHAIALAAELVRYHR